MPANNISKAQDHFTARDEATALNLARYECETAGMGAGPQLSDNFVRAAQKQRFDELQQAHRKLSAPVSPPEQKRLALPAPAPAPAPAPKKAAVSAEAPNVIGTPESLNSSRFDSRFRPVSGGSPDEHSASTARAPKLRAVLSRQCDLVEVRGDGNCGYYAVLAGIVRMAVQHVGLRKTIVQNIRALADADHTEALGAIGQHPAHERAICSQAIGKRTLNDIADKLESASPSAALAFIEEPFSGSCVKDAVYVLRAKACEVEANDGEAAGCGFARADEMVYLTASLMGPNTGCTIFTTRVRNDEPTVDPDDIAVGSEHNTLYMLQSNDNHYDLLVPKAAQ